MLAKQLSDTHLERTLKMRYPPIALLIQRFIVDIGVTDENVTFKGHDSQLSSGGSQRFRVDACQV
jgi:hypothetical protein